MHNVQGYLVNFEKLIVAFMLIGVKGMTNKYYNFSIIITFSIYADLGYPPPPLSLENFKCLFILFVKEKLIIKQYVHFASNF